MKRTEPPFFSSLVEKQFTDGQGREVVHFRGRKVAVDVGNAEVKFIFGPYPQEAFVIPNVVAEMEFKSLLAREQEVLAALRVYIESPSLKRKWATMAVGELASRQKYNKEMLLGSIKAEEDQIVILLLTGLAVDAVRNFPIKDSICYATYYLYTGLPISEYRKKELRKKFRSKLMESIHTVRFLETAYPYNEVEVRIQIVDMKLMPEGQTIHLELTTDDFGQYKPMPRTDESYLIFDVGGGGLDIAVMTEGGSTDNKYSESYDIGINEVLDRINEEIYDRFKTTFSSRRELTKHLLHSLEHNQTGRRVKSFFVRGKPQPIQDIVNRQFCMFTKRLYRILSEKWRDVPGCNAAYFVGGGSVMIRPYLSDLNGGEGKSGKYEIYFIEPSKSFWSLANALYKIVRFHRANNK